MPSCLVFLFTQPINISTGHAEDQYYHRRSPISTVPHLYSPTYSEDMAQNNLGYLISTSRIVLLTLSAIHPPLRRQVLLLLLDHCCHSAPLCSVTEHGTFPPETTLPPLLRFPGASTQRRSHNLPSIQGR